MLTYVRCILTVLMATAMGAVFAQQHAHEKALKLMDARLQQTMKATDDEHLVCATVTTVGTAHELVRQITDDGHSAKAITAAILSVRTTKDYLLQLALKPGVVYIQQSRQMSPFMDVARSLTGADLAHSGSQLETPFTGRGVVIGIIDQGFEYRHVAFLDADKQSRVRAIWNRWGYSEGTDSEPTSEIPASGDGISSTAHATHVTGIAAGSKISENDWYGIAPDAELVMIPSEFNSAEVMEDVRYVADLARSEGKPWVINMSFGSNLGPHDATDPTFQAIDEIITEQPGGMIVAAIGNDGLQPMHARHVFETLEDTVRLLARCGNNGVIIDFWSLTADSATHLALQPYIYHDGETTLLDSTVISEILTHEIAPYNRKEHNRVAVSASALQHFGREAMLGVKCWVKDGAKGAAFDAWTTANYGSLAEGPDATYIVPDNEYTIAEPANSLIHGVSVGAYNSRVSYDNLNGATQHSFFGEEGEICSFSNAGPSLHDVPQPTVAAPGSQVISALSKYELGFSSTADHITGDVKRGLKHFYYGAYAGTSMASPQVTGSIALWLQANPRLTCNQIIEIIQQSSRMPDNVSVDDRGWHAQWGYGKIDTYEGLKLALLLAKEREGVTSVEGTDNPFTLSKESECWRVLFNSWEPWAILTVTDISGRVLVSRHWTDISCGEEKVISFSSLPLQEGGVLLVRLQSAHCDMVRKILIPEK